MQRIAGAKRGVPAMRSIAASAELVGYGIFVNLHFLRHASSVEWGIASPRSLPAWSLYDVFP